MGAYAPEVRELCRCLRCCILRDFLTVLHCDGLPLYFCSKGAQARAKIGIDVNVLSRFEKAEKGTGGEGGAAKEKGEGSEQVKFLPRFLLHLCCNFHSSTLLHTK
jgi:hypothetical protein